MVLVPWVVGQGGVPTMRGEHDEPLRHVPGERRLRWLARLGLRLTWHRVLQGCDWSGGDVSGWGRWPAAVARESG